MDLVEYVLTHTNRSECRCGRCLDHVEGPAEAKPHTADLVFFQVSKVGETNAEEFKRLTKEWPGDYTKTDPFDGKDHSYMELGAWLGSQELAMLYMGLGTVLGLFSLLTPETLLKVNDEKLALYMAQQGFLSVIAKESKEA